MAFYDCERCGDDGASNIMQGHSVLCECVHAKLCTRCLNLWNMHKEGCPAEVAWNAMIAKWRWFESRSRAGDAPSAEEHAALLAEETAARRMVRDIGLAFIRPIPREQAQLEAANAGQTYPMSQRRLD